MNYRIASILASETATTAATKTIDLDMSDVISRLVVQFKGTNGGSTPTAHGATMVTKIELVDGSDVLFSLSGKECQALNFYDTGHMPWSAQVYMNDVQNIQTFHLSFGRYLWDTELALDPNRFRNLQLKITHTAISGGSTPDAATMSVFAYVFDEKRPSPSGFLMAKEHYSYTLVASAHEYINLPTDYPIRKLMIASLATTKQPWEQYNKIKLSEDNDKKVVINNESTSDLFKLFYVDYEIIETMMITGTGSEVTFYCTPSYDVKGTLTGISGTQAAAIINYAYGGTIPITSDSAEHSQVLIQGRAPHGALALPFGDEDNISDWYNVTKLKQLRLDITAGSGCTTSSTAQIVIQQYRRY